MSNPAITLEPPSILAFTDGQFTGAYGQTGGTTAPGAVRGFNPNNRRFWQVPAITPGVGERTVVPVAQNKRLVYINGINTSMAAHAYTVKLAAVVSGATVIGIYNQSGDGTNTNMIMDLVQCLGDKTGLNNNPATRTVGRSVYHACTSEKYLNIIAHSQGALITSRGLRQGIGLLLDYYGRRNVQVRPLIEQVERRRNFFQSVLRNMIHADDIDRARLEAALRRHVLPGIERRLNSFVSVQTFGGAGSFYPDGPVYRHVNNGWDPVSNAFGQGAFIHSGGRGAQQVQIERNSGMRIRDVADHSIDALYLQASEYYIDRTGRRVDNSYIPIDMTMVRG